MASFVLRLGLAVITAIALMSLGGEAIFASPVLVPLLVLAAIKSGVPGRLVFSVLTGLVLAEVTWAIVLLAVGHVTGTLWLLPAAVAAVVLAGCFAISGLRAEPLS